MKNDLIYVYCLTDSLPLIALSNVSEGIEFLRIKDFYAILKYVSNVEFAEENLKKNISDIKWLENNARGHINVISSFMKNQTVIPFKFGTIFQTEDSLKKFIYDYDESLTENFQFIENKEEWSIKIYCSRESLCQQIDILSSEAASLEKQIMASLPGKAFILKHKKKELIEKELNRLCKNFGQNYYDIFSSLSVSTRLNNLLPKEFTGRVDSMILNATFLINKSMVPEFIFTVEIMQKSDKSTGFFIESTGPWPPFSFINIKEK